MKLKSYQVEKAWLLIIVAFAFFFRLYQYDAFSLSNDELSALHRLHFNSFGEMLQQGVRPDGHPAGAQVLLWITTHHASNSPAALRLPFVVLSALAPLFAFLFVRKLYGPAPALFTAAFLAFSEYPLLYGQMARPYGIGLTFTMLAAWLWAELVFDTGKAKNYLPLSLLLGLAWALCLYTHYFAGLTALIMGLSGFLFIDKKRLKYYLGAALWASLLFAPHLPLTLHQLSLGGVGSWLAKPSPDFFGKHLLHIFGSTFVLSLSLLALASAAILQSRNISRDIIKRLLLLSWFLLPILIGYYYSVAVDSVLQHSVLLFSMPFIAALLFSFAPQYLNKKTRIILLIFSLLLASDTFVFSPYYQKQHFGEFQKTAAMAQKYENSLRQKHSPYAHIAEVNDPFYLRYYRKDLSIFPHTHFKKQDDFKILKHFLDTTQAKTLIISDPQGIMHYQARNMLLTHFPKLIDCRHYGKAYSLVLRSDDNPTAFPVSLWPDKSDTLLVQKYGACLSRNEYSCSTQKIFTPEKAVDDSLFIYIKCIIDSAYPNTGAHIVCSLQSLDKKYKQWLSAPFDLFIKKGAPQAKALLMKAIKVAKHSPCELKIYLWNPKKTTLRIHQWEATVCTRNQTGAAP